MDLPPPDQSSDFILLPSLYRSRVTGSEVEVITREHAYA